MEMIGVYITLYQNTVTQYISMQQIFNIMVAEDQSIGSPELLQWREQVMIQFGDGGEAEEETNEEGGELDLG